MVNKMNIDLNSFANEIAENEKKRKKKYKQNVEFRRNRVQSLLIRGNTQWEIAESLGVSQATVSRDIQWIRDVAKKELKVTVEKKLPEEYHKYLVGINEALRIAWTIALSGKDDKTQLDALQFVIECSKRRMDAIINPPVLTKSSNHTKRFKGNNYLDADITRNSNQIFAIGKKEINEAQNADQCTAAKV